MFEKLIIELSTNKQNKVVVLIDDYDGPFLNNTDIPDVAQGSRNALREFYAVLKDAQRHIAFVFITGVIKFSRTSIFSGINNLRDLNLDPRAAQLLGFTENEVSTYFSKYLEHHAHSSGQSVEQILEKLRYWYNGYQFCEPKKEAPNGSKVYNPLSVLLCLSTGELRKR